MNRRRCVLGFGYWALGLAYGSSSIGSVAKSQERATQSPQLKWVTEKAEGVGLSFHTFYSRAIEQSVSFHIYTPIGYSEDEAKRLPVVYWLHGSGGGTAGISRLTALANEAIESGKSPPFHMVFVNGLRMGMYLDWANGTAPIETIIINELIPHIDANWRTIAIREGRLIEGFSMGGYGAARLGLKYPHLFGSISIMGAGPLQERLESTPRASKMQASRLLQEVYGGEQERFRELSPRRYAQINVSSIASGTRLRVIVGDKDETFEHNNSFHMHLSRLNIPHDWIVLPNIGHNPMEVLTALGDRRWAFYRASFAALKN